MANSEREQAFFGGWRRRTLTPSTDTAWGDPQIRNGEFDIASGQAGILLPDPAIEAATPLGAPMVLVNRGPGGLQVRDSDGSLLDVLGTDVGARLMLRQREPQLWSIKRHAFRTVLNGAGLPAQTFNLDLAVNEANANILRKIVAMGYTGAAAAFVRVRVRAGVLLGSVSVGQPSVWSGLTESGVSWFAGSVWLLTLEPNVTLGGAGGRGGRGGIPGTGSAPGIAGEAGGRAVRTEIALRLELQSGAVLFGGGGGGGGGSSSSTILTVQGGGGGGARGVRMTAAGALLLNDGGQASGIAQRGNPGAAHSAGGGGIGAGGGGNGGRGGFAAQAGEAGTIGANGGAGGAAGIAISYSSGAGAPVVLTGASQIIGTTVLE